MDVSRLSCDELPDDIALRLREASLFSSSGFARLWAAQGGSDVYWIVGEKSSPTAVLTGVEFGKRPSRRFQSMPDGLYSRLVMFDEDADVGEVSQALLKGLEGAGYLKLYLTDYYGSLVETAEFKSVECETGLVDITQPDWQPPDKKLQSEIRKAEREGVASVPFDLERHFDSFVSLMQASEKRHGREPKYPEQFFRRLAELAQRDARIRWVVVEHEEALATSHIFLVDADQIINWQVYFSKGFSFLKANQFVLYSMAREYAAQGVRHLNLGASPPEAETLSTYKKKWGGETHKYTCLQRESWLGKLV